MTVAEYSKNKFLNDRINSSVVTFSELYNDLRYISSNLPLPLDPTTQDNLRGVIDWLDFFDTHSKELSEFLKEVLTAKGARK